MVPRRGSACVRGVGSHGKVPSCVIHTTGFNWGVWRADFVRSTVTPSGTCRVLGASLSLIVALLLRSAPYPDWRWQQVHFLKLLDGIRGGYTAKHYSLNVANCPGLLFCLSGLSFAEMMI
jgi:hypothetical protein